MSTHGFHLTCTETGSVIPFFIIKSNMYFSVEYLLEMLQCESYKRRMMAIMSLEVICLAKDKYWQCILDAGDVEFIHYLLLMLFNAELYYIQLITLNSIFNCGEKILVDFKFLLFFLLGLLSLFDNLIFYFPQG